MCCYLRVFLSVAHTGGSVTRSSEQIFKAASAITRALTQLEELAGCQPVRRRPRGMLLNAYGEAVHRRALRILRKSSRASALCQSPRQPYRPTPLTQLLLGGNKLRIFVSLAEHGQFSQSASSWG
jgi:LysR family transcriptional regulator of gallate degradation